MINSWHASHLVYTLSRVTHSVREGPSVRERYSLVLCRDVTEQISDTKACNIQCSDSRQDGLHSVVFVGAFAVPTPNDGVAFPAAAAAAAANVASPRLLPANVPVDVV